MTSEAAPRLKVQPRSIVPAGEPDCYEIRWRLENLSNGPVEVVESWMPHSQFLAPRELLRPALIIPALGDAALRRIVRLPAEQDLVVENGFLNLRVQFQGRVWRVLIRMRVERRAPASVSVRVDAITAHRVGFAEAPAEEQR